MSFCHSRKRTHAAAYVKRPSKKKLPGAFLLLMGYNNANSLICECVRAKYTHQRSRHIDNNRQCICVRGVQGAATNLKTAWLWFGVCCIGTTYTKEKTHLIYHIYVMYNNVFLLHKNVDNPSSKFKTLIKC